MGMKVARKAFTKHGYSKIESTSLYISVLSARKSQNYTFSVKIEM
jgi:hypothetical protein